MALLFVEVATRMESLQTGVVLFANRGTCTWKSEESHMDKQNPTLYSPDGEKHAI